MGTVAKIYKQGELKVSGVIDERLPVITDGLVAHYPFDDGTGGFDIIGGGGTSQNIEQNLNLIEAMNMDWRDPSSWSNSRGFEWSEDYQAIKITGYVNSWLKTPIVVDTNKEYQISMEILEEVSGAAGLYLGGVDYNEAGQKVTINYDYTLASNTTPPLGEWITYRTTRTGTGSIANQTSTSFDNVTGWVGNAQTDNLTKYYHLGGLFNYNSGGVMYVRNLSIVAIDSDTSNASYVGNGVTIQKTTKNGMNDSDFENVAVGSTMNWIENLGVGGEYGVVDGFGYSGSKSFIVKNGTSGGDGTVKLNNVSLVGATQIEFSAWVYSTEAGAKVKFLDFTDPVPQTNNVHSGNGWEFLWVVYDDVAASFGLKPFFDIGTQITPCYFDNLMLQANSFPSAWIPDVTVFPTGLTGGQLSISNPVKSGEYTMSFKGRVLTNLTYPLGYQTIFCVGNYSTNNSWTIMDFNGTEVSGVQTLIRKGNAGDWHWMTGSFTSAGDFNDEITYTVVRNATNYIGYANGVEIGSMTHLASDMQDLIWVGSRENGGRVGASTIRDLSIYNRALTPEEVKKLANSNVEISETTMSLNNVEEQPYLPDGAYYFPLTEDGEDYTKFVTPFESINLNNEDRAIWVGSSTSNTFSLPDFDFPITSNDWNYWNQTGGLGSNGQTTNRAFIRGNNKTYSHWVQNEANATGNYLLYQSPVFAGGYRSSQAIIKMSDGSPVDSTKVFPVHNANNGGTPSGVWTSIEHIGGGWYHCKAEGFSQDGSNDLVGFYTRPGYRAYFDFCQVEDKIFSSPLVNGTRGVSSLEFNLYSSINMDWSGDWTISYWKKPHGTYLGNLTSYNIDSLGANNNSVGGGYIWWGKNNNEDVLRDSVPSEITPSNYFKKWHLIVMTKSSTTITIKTIGIEGNELSIRTVDETTTASNYYVNQYGYDFKLGGWDSANGCNSYYRDLVILKRAITSEEEKNLYAQMSIYKNKTNIKEIIEEGI